MYSYLLLLIFPDYHTTSFWLRTFPKDCILFFLLPRYQTTDSQRNKVLISSLRLLQSLNKLRLSYIYLLFCMWAHVPKKIINETLLHEQFSQNGSTNLIHRHIVLDSKPLNPTFVNIQSVLPEQLITTSMGIFSLSFSFAYESRGQRKQGWQVTLSYHLPFCWGVSQKNFVWVRDAGVNTTQPHIPNNHYHTTTVVLLWEISLMYTINVMKISRMDKFIKGQQSRFMYSRVDNINTHL